MRGSSPRMTLRVWRGPIHLPLIPVPAGVYHRAELRADPLAGKGSSGDPARLS